MKKIINKYGNYATVGITSLVLISSLVPVLPQLISVAHATNSQTLTAIKDTYINQDKPTDNYGNDNDLKVKSRDNSKNKRSLVAFDVSSLPAGIAIQSATLRLYANGAPGSTRTYLAHRITQNWSESSSTWNNSSSTFNTSPTASTSTDHNGYTLWDVTNDVINFYNGTSTNYGWLIKDQNENYDQTKEIAFTSKDDTQHPSQRPELVVVYTQTTGTITIIKDAHPNDPQDFQFTGDLGTFYLDDDSDQTLSNQATFTVAPGTYSVAEEIVPSGWTNVSAVCSDGSSINAINVSAQENVTCTFTNNKLGTIIVEKQTNPDGAVGGFTFTGNANGTISDNGQIVVSNLSPGTYTSTEDVFAGFDLTSITCDDNNSTGDLETRTATFNVEIGETVKCIFNNRQRGSITVQKIADPNVGEFQFNLTGLDYSSSTTITGTNFHTFGSLVPQNYSLSEIMPEGWTAYPNPPLCSDQSSPENIGVSAGEDVICYFNNTQYSTIGGVKFNDTNGNGVRDDGEPGIENWQIALSDGSVMTYTTTSQNGNYIFTGLLPGQYNVSETGQGGWLQTAPGGQGNYNVDLSAGQDSIDNNFGNFKYGKISGYKFEDVNGNGVRDEGDNSLNSWTINLFNGQSASTTLTDGSGYYEFTGLLTGEYTVSETNQEGWVQTKPSPTSTYSITVVSGTNSGPNDFGNFRPGKISGYKFNDVNGNGIQDEGDLMLGNWTIRLFNGQSTSTATTGENGYYEFTGLPAGAYTVSENNQQGWTQTFPTSSSNYSIQLQSGANSGPNNFGNAILLVISNETHRDAAQTSMTVTWETNKPATSRVVYDTASHPDLGSASNYGYANSTAEQDIDPKVSSHSVGLSGLTAGTTYYYRVISAASPETVGAEQTFSTQSPPAPSGGGDGGGGGGGGGGMGSTAPIIVSHTPTNITANSTDIIWSTNYFSGSRAIFDTVSHPAAGTAPNYGYANSTASDSAQVTGHTSLLTGLAPDTTYFYRVVAEGNPTLSSFEGTFKTLASLLATGGQPIQTIGGGSIAPSAPTGAGGGRQPGEIGGGGVAAGAGTEGVTGETAAAPEVTGQETKGLATAGNALTLPSQAQSGLNKLFAQVSSAFSIKWIKYFAIILVISLLGWLVWFLFFRKKRE
jgi:hypothetical protein